MDMQKRNSQIIVVTIAILSAVILAGLAYWWHVRLEPTVSTTANPTPSVSVGSWKTLLATFSPGGSDRSDANDREVEYKLFSVQAPNLAEEQLGSVASNIFVNTFQYMDGNVYFVNGDGELAMYNLATKKSERVALPDIKPVFGFLDVHSVYDFGFVDTMKLVYLQGACTDGSACSLKEYDFTTKKATSIIDHIEKKFSINGETTIKIQGADGTDNSVRLIRTRNTADGGFADLISVALDTHKDTVLQTVNFTTGSKNPDADALFGKTFLCGDVSGTQELADVTGQDDNEMQITAGVKPDGLVKKYHPTYFVGCVMPK